MHLHESVKYIIFLLVGVVIGYGIPYVFNDNKTYSSYEVDKISDSYSSPSFSKDAIEADNQIAGNKVFIKKVSLAESSWVAIQELATGKILGAQMFGVGESSGDVDLLRDTAPESMYSAIILSDDGDKIFDLKKDSYALNSDGKVISVLFKATN